MRFKTLISIVVLGVMAACSSQSTRHDMATELSSRQMVAEGSAVIGDSGKDAARRAAIDAAVGTASVQLRRNAGATAMLIGDVKVVDEWQEAGVYHVQVLAMLMEKQQCASSYRKKIVATAFPIMNIDQVSSLETQDLYSGIPREITNRLMETGDFIGRNLTNAVLYSRPDMAPEILSADGSSTEYQIQHLARLQNAQFVLSGVIRDFRIESTDYVRGGGVLAELKSRMRDYIARRGVGIDVYVHDGMSGALLFQHRYTDSVLGDVSLPNGYNVGSERFNATPAGNKLNEIIQQASDDIHRLFSCYPFASRVLQVANNRIVIAAGSQDKIKVGDQLMVYAAALSGGGLSEPEGVLTITDVNAATASGSLDATAHAGVVKPGDWVKSFSTP